MVVISNFEFDGVSSIFAEFMSYLFFNFFQLFFQLYFVRSNMYVTQTPQATDSTRPVQGACYTTSWLQSYTRLPPASRAGSNTTRVRWFVRAEFLWLRSCFCYRTLRPVGLRVSAAV